MEITVNRAELAAAITWARRSIGKRPALAVLAALRVAVSDGRLTMEGFSYEMVTRAHAAAVSGYSAAGDVLVDGAELATAARLLPPGQAVQVTLTAAGDGILTLDAGGVSCRVATLPAAAGADFPALPVVPEHAGTVVSYDFCRAVARVCAAAGRDQGLPALLCVALELGGRLAVEATDRRRLAAQVLHWAPASVPDGRPPRALVPAVALARFAKAAGGGKIAIGYSPDPPGRHGHASAGGWVSLASDEREMIARAEDWPRFPECQVLVSLCAGHETVITAESAVLLAAVKRAGAACLQGDLVRLEIGGGTVTVSVHRDGAVISSEDLQAQSQEGPGRQLQFDPGSLLSMIAAAASGRPLVRIGVEPAKADQPTAARPVTISGVGDNDFAALLVPIRFGS